MTEEQIALAKRAVACKGWRWMPGMLTMDDERMSDEGWPDYEAMDYGASSVVETVEWRDRAKRNAIPDLTDPATLGCLLALVREAWELPLLGVAFDYDAGEWVVRSWNATILWQGIGASEAHALVAALEAAPR